MTQNNTTKRWSKTGKASKALELAGGVWIFKIPSREGGKPSWWRGKLLDVSSLDNFYRGSKEEPGPARKFAQNGQEIPVKYKLPSGIVTPEGSWKIVDLGRFMTEVDGNSEAMYNGDTLPFVTSEEVDGKRRLIYLDAKEGEAMGSDGLFLLESFEPSVELAEII